ncbi:acyl-CoA thioesterase [Sulfurovum mangrovi]|uniref:acyl-CoA thioesterase n=1 Tax=Sulfurovum mangrovi TaxID=2893889 RepID=UPI001E44AEB3|nr:hotdog domain-containing protein [Sulfurovum mangrovi]UFH60342.1 acyl-CoA thioesterase [Sulfurovum mangrovi]
MRNLTLRIQAYPGDLNPIGTVFGGWIMSMMDKAASIAVDDLIDSPAVTVGVTDLRFIKPVRSGDIVTIYTTIQKIGNTSISVYVEVVVECHKLHCDARCEMSVTDATFTFVAISKEGEPLSVRSVLRTNLDQDILELLK